MNGNYEKQLGANIKVLRENKGWTQEQLAAKLQTAGIDITRSALAKIEVGQRHLYADELRGLKEVLHVAYEDILK